MLTAAEAKKATCPLCAARLAECPVTATGVVLVQLRFNVLVGVGVEGGHVMFLTTLGKIGLCAADRIKGEGPSPADAGADAR
jgi:hypothetical protein